MEMKLPNLTKLATVTHTVSMDFDDGGGGDSDAETVVPPNQPPPRPSMKDRTVKEHAQYLLNTYGDIIESLPIIAEALENPPRIEGLIGALEELMKEAIAVVATGREAGHDADPDTAGAQLDSYASDVEEAHYRESSVRNELQTIYRLYQNEVEEAYGDEMDGSMTYEQAMLLGRVERDSENLTELMDLMDNVGLLSHVEW